VRDGEEFFEERAVMKSIVFAQKDHDPGRFLVHEPVTSTRFATARRKAHTSCRPCHGPEVERRSDYYCSKRSRSGVVTMSSPFAKNDDVGYIGV
jgi:hypothetical protein